MSLPLIAAKQPPTFHRKHVAITQCRVVHEVTRAQCAAVVAAKLMMWGVFRSATLMSAFGTNQTSQRHRLMSAFEFREAPRRSTNADADCETFTILSCSGLTFFGIK